MKKPEKFNTNRLNNNVLENDIKMFSNNPQDILSKRELGQYLNPYQNPYINPIIKNYNISVNPLTDDIS